MNRTEIHKTNLRGMYDIHGGYTVFSYIVVKQSRAYEHSAAAAATLSSPRATTLD